MDQPTFIVGTGRCGSTMISNMLREHPHILIISEFFCFITDLGGQICDAFTEDLIDGKTFFKIVGETASRTNILLKHNVAPTEILYPFSSFQYRFSSLTGVPPILNVTLPYLTDDFEDLFDEIKLLLIERQKASVTEHYQYLFNWLQRKFNKFLWIERTGAALMIIEQILETFPDARFIHIVRDGRNCAISMSNHLGFRIFLLGKILTEYLGIDPYKSKDRNKINRLPLELQRFLPESFDREAFLEYQPPLFLCGQLWSQQIIKGLSILRLVPQERVFTIVYEDLLKNPQISLEKLLAFLGKEFIDPDWIEKASVMVRKPRSSWLDLADCDRSELIKACQPGFEALRNSQYLAFDSFFRKF